MRPRTVTLALAAVVIATLALAAPASAAPRLEIRGHGFGHGVGMSQYGAYGYARHGRDYRFILAHYYTGTALGQTDPKRVVRVLLQANVQRVRFSGALQADGHKLSPSKTYEVVQSGLDQVELRTAAGTSLGNFGGVLRVVGPGSVRLLGRSDPGVRDGRYRGTLEIRRSPVSGINAINAVGVDEYAQGVVPGEVPAIWPVAALEAQAVAARTYGITTDAGGAGFDQYADTRSQVYRGMSGEDPRTNAAVTATRGEVVTYAGKPAVTFFFSTSGGRTENVELSFTGSRARPWLVSVDDPYDSLSPRHKWGPLRFSFAAAARRLRGILKGSFRGIRVIKRGRSPRIVSAYVIGSRGRTKVSGATLRARFGLYDTWAYFKVVGATVPPAPAPAPTPQPGGGGGGISPP